jgi:hypothetical protein
MRSGSGETVKRRGMVVPGLASLSALTLTSTSSYEKTKGH